MSGYNFNYNLDGSQAVSVQQTIPTQQQTPQVERDPRVWSADLTDEVKLYNADVRILPESNIDPNTGMDNLNGYPSRLILKHRLRMGKSKTLNVKCLKRDPNDRRKNICPYCDWAWNRYYLMKNADANTVAELQRMGLNLQEEMKSNMNNMNHERWACNVLIRDDSIHPEYNGQVKIWEHSQKVNDMLDNPKDPCEVEYRKRVRKAKKGETPEYPSAALYKNVARFTPEHPIVGHDFSVVCCESGNVIQGNKKPLPTYDSSTFSPNASRLAETDDLMISILQQRHNLEEYAYGDIPTYEEAKKRLDEWLIQASIDNNGSGAIPTSSATVANAQNYQSAMSHAPAPAAKPMQNVAGSDFARGYTQQTALQTEAASQQAAFASPAAQAAPAQVAPNMSQQAPTFAMPATQTTGQPSYQAAPQQQAFTMPAAQTAPQPSNFGMPGANAAPKPQADVVIDDDDLPF